VIGVDIFRIANGKIAEHWDVLQEEVPAAESVNGNSMVTTSQT
jgi:predicted SnoaL-like aldol condensation-catalyzing enzyme